jgi:hypothetical protein
MYSDILLNVPSLTIENKDLFVIAVFLSNAQSNHFDTLNSLCHLSIIAVGI